MTPFIIGVAGGSGSGKTTVSSQIQAMVGVEHIVYLQHDSYYREYDHLTLAQRAQVNYDHPASLETSLLVQHLQELRQGRPVRTPSYDFARYARRAETELVYPAQVILVEGILILGEKELRELMDMRIYVDADADLRFIRRMQRDMRERGRSLESIVTQYLATVRPMHLEFVEPNKRYADVIIPEGGNNRVAMEMVASRIQAILQNK
jgi:uridine kinase